MSEEHQSGDLNQQKCDLCSKISHGSFRKPTSWSEENRDWVNKYTPGLPDDAQICEACNKCVQHHTGRDYTPRWIPKEPKTQNPCMVKECSNPSRGATSITYSTAQLHLNLESSKGDAVSLCNKHYQQLYKEVNAPSVCATCASLPRYDEEKYIRRCPDPDTITQHLRDTIGFDGILSTDSKVCKACYEFQHHIVEQKKEYPTLEYLASSFEEKIQAFQSIITNKVTAEEYLDMVVAKTGLRLVAILENDGAVLLPVLHADFCKQIQEDNFSRKLSSSPPTTNWLLSSLSIQFKHTIGVACKHKQYGILVYLRDGDMLKALSKALGTAKESNQKNVTVHKELQSVLKDSTSDEFYDITKACHILNQRILKQAKSLAIAYQSNPHLCSDFNPKALLQELDPVLVKSIKILTTPGKGKKRSSEASELQLKSIKQLFCLCTILFTANQKCNMPIHYLLTDAVLCLGGSTELVKILNRLGAAVSLDTHKRVATWVVSERMKNGIHSELVPNTITVTSIDNLDIMQSHAMVATSESKRSWHGASVQSAQPLPESSIMCDEEHTDKHPTETVRKHGASSSLAPEVKQLAKRRRTLQEHSHSTTALTIAENVPADMFRDMYESTDYQRPTISQFTVHSFQILPHEEQLLCELDSTLFQYFCLKEGKAQDVKLPGFPSFISAKVYGIEEDQEVSKIVYVDIISLPADSKDTILKVLHKLHRIFIIEQSNRWLIVVGDAKTYDILQTLKREYGAQIEWMLPMPGDWHILFNYQKVLIKVYGEAGLLELAKVAGHRAETLTSLAQASHFKRTHHFILQSFETLQRTILKTYLQNLESESSTVNIASAFRTATSGLAEKLSQVSSISDFTKFTEHLESTFSGPGVLRSFESGFKVFTDGLCSQQDTARFWLDYLTKNCMAYIALHTAIRNGDWYLRMAAIKLMAAVFSAFDRPIYQRLVPQHLADILCFPPTVLHHLKKGAISVRITKATGHAVALDEAHEMEINREAKFAIVRPSEKLMEKLSNFMPFRSKCLRNLKQQLGLTKEPQIAFPTATSRDLVADQNILAMLDYVEENNMIPGGEDNLGLQNFLTHVKATPEQAKDLLQFRSVGQAEFEAHISYRILRTPSTSAPQRRKRLQTFSSGKTLKQKQKQCDRDAKIQKICMKKQLVMLSRGEKLPLDYSSNFNSMPLALVGSDGRPYQKNKSKTTDFFETRYKSTIVHQLPPGWIPESVIMEGMFLIQTPPPPGITNFTEYINMLLERYACPHLKAGVKELHILFDDPGQMLHSPKEIERSTRDESAPVNVAHHCTTINSSAAVPTEWRKNLLNCRQCKRALCDFFSQAILELAPAKLAQNQTVITAGGFAGERRNQCWSVSKNGQPQPLPSLRSDSEESDLRIWLHCIKSRKLLYSPDTDVYHVGLPIIAKQLHGTSVYVQLKGRAKDTKRYVSLNTFITSLDADPDFAQVPREKRAQIIQSAYTMTGCDYTSYFRGIGKVFFLKVLFQHATFITSEDPCGSLADFNSDHALLAFMRLVGTAYFKKHVSAFKYSTPESLYNSIEASSIVDQHKKWLDVIRKTVWGRTGEEKHYLPSYEALELHWKRSIWVLHYWSKATDQVIEVPTLTDFGWYRENGVLKVRWDIQENIQKVEDHISFLTTGCKCKTGCATRRCGCKKSGLHCGPSCQCINCQNIQLKSTQTEEEEREVQEEVLEESDDEYDMEDHDETEPLAENDYSLEEDLEFNKNLQAEFEDIFGSDSDSDLDSDSNS